MGVENAVSAVGGFPGEGEPAPFAVELGAPLDQLLNQAGAFGNQYPDCFRITEAGAGDEGVLFMKFYPVVIAENDGNSTLGILRRRFFEGILGDDQNVTGRSQIDSCTHTGDPGADHQEICFEEVLRIRYHSSWYNFCMPTYMVKTRQRHYPAVVERGAIATLADHLPAGTGKLFVITTEDVWSLHGARLRVGLGSRKHTVLLFPGGEERKRLSEVERLAEQMVEAGGDRSSVVITFGGGIVDDVGGFVAASFMRGVPVIQIPTTLLAQVDAGVGGKTGVNLVSGKNLVGAFHQPLAALIDPDVLGTLPVREYRAGLYEALKTGIIRSEPLFRLMVERREEMLALDPDIVVEMVARSVEIKAEVVSADERESNLRRILNFGHTLGHALEAETGYSRLLHGEAVAFGMRAAVHLACLRGDLSRVEDDRIVEAIAAYGALPPLDDLRAERLIGRLRSDKKTVKGAVHFVLPVRIGEVKVVSGISEDLIVEAVNRALRELAEK